MAAILSDQTRRQLVNKFVDDNNEPPLSTSWLDERLENSQLPTSPHNETAGKVMQVDGIDDTALDCHLSALQDDSVCAEGARLSLHSDSLLPSS